MTDPPSSDDHHDATRRTIRLVAPAPVPLPPGTPDQPVPAAIAVANRILGITVDGETNPFSAYTELRSRVPQRVWQTARLISLAAFVGLVITMFVRPAGGLFVLFRVIVPLLPAVFLLAHPADQAAAQVAVRHQLAVSPVAREALRGGDWSALHDIAATASSRFVRSSRGGRGR